MADAPTQDGEHARWVTEIMLYEKESRPWTDKSKKILRRYKDERNAANASSISRFNILWSNVQTLAPALYAMNPKPDIERRFKDKDDVGRFASQVLERSTSYFINTDLFAACMNQGVVDRLLPGRGTAWVRYVPHFKDAALQGNDEVMGEGTQVTEDVYSKEEKPGATEEPSEAPQEIDYEEVCPDYVHWEDFGHTLGRTWEEVRAGWRKVYLDRKENIERFGKVIGSKIPLDHSPKDLADQKITDDLKKSTIYEIWDKPSKTAIWLHKDVTEILDSRPDPLRLPNFFPFPRPMYPRMANDSLIPVPDFIQYQDQALELDDLTGRITAITKAVKVAGVYDASAEGLQRLLAEGTDNQLIPVEQWAVHADKGGLKGVVDFMPLQDIVAALISLHDARDKVKQTIYEITGISDIIRGASNPNETATAQKIKGQFGTLRLDDMQSDVQRFAREMVRITAHIIAEHFQLETIKKISGIKLMTAQEKQQFQQQQAMQMQQMAAQQPPPQPGQPPAPPPQPPPIPEEMQELLANPTWEDVFALLRDDALLCFRVDIETDSTIKMDEDAERDARVQMLTAVGGFLQQAAAIPEPALRPMLMQLLMFGVRGFKVGKELESTFEIALKKMEDAASQPQPPQQDPSKEIEAVKQQSQLQIQQKDIEGKSKEIQHQTEMAGANQKVAETQLQAKSDKIMNDVERVVMEFEKRVNDTMLQSKDAESAQVKPDIEGKLAEMHQEMMQAIMGVLSTLNQPKTITAQRQSDGSMTGQVLPGGQ